VRTVAPSVARHVRARDGYRCSVPGCNNTRWLDNHHLDWRQNGGDNSKENLALTCTRHHRMLHNKQLFVTPTPAGLIWRDAHGRILQGSAPVVSETDRYDRGDVEQPARHCDSGDEQPARHCHRDEKELPAREMGDGALA